MERLYLPAKIENLDQMMEFIATAAVKQGFVAEQVNKIKLAAEEALVNVIRYAYVNKPDGGMEISCDNKDTCLEIEISDHGVAFDPLSLPDPDICAPLEDRRIGGLGIFMMKKIMDEVRYRRENDENVLTMVKYNTCCAPVSPVVGPSQCRWPISIMKKEGFKKGETLFKAGDKADRMFYIAKGVIRLVEINKLIRAGEVIGEMGIFSPFKERTASAVCEEDIEVYTMGRDEVIKFFGQDPALAIELIQLSIKRFIENLKAETAARERMESELRIAQQIQSSMLPTEFPRRDEFAIFGRRHPAIEVGGDFYDFFFIDDGRLCFVIGDVSGKGVPAALFMAITKTLIKNEAKRGLPTNEILARVNNIICPDNQTCQFVTVFCAILDIKTGALQFCNAGHNPPLVCDSSGCFDYLKIPGGFVVGVMENTLCEKKELVLKTGDMIFLYTDGVTEAMNPQQQQFSEARLKEALTRCRDKDLQAMITAMREEVRVFAQDAQQSDDITMLAVRYKGSA